MGSRIFVGYDGTGASISAVKWAVDEARLRQARLHIVTCYDIPPTGDAAYGSPPGEDFEASFLVARRAAHEMQEAIEFEDPGVEVAVQITAGSPAMELLAEAATRDLIVIGASRRHRTQAILFGSTGRQLARHQTCPLVVVRVTSGEGPSRRVVVGVDGSSGALPAVRWAADEAELRQVDIRLVHVWEPHDISREKADEMLEAAEVCVGKRAAVSVRTDIVEHSPELAFADILAPEELLVIGSHARGRLKTALFGSTVNNLIEQSPATVVIVPRQRSD